MFSLDDLDNEARLKTQEEEEGKKVEVEKVEDDKKDDDDEYESSVEEDLSTALSLLEDCHSVFEDILKTKNRRGLSTYLYSRSESLTLEIMAFILQWDIPVKEEDQHINWKDEI